jgi:uncharacterized protein YlxW (UPF0749 family)
MKNNEASIFVFIAAVIIGILISLNINFNRTYNRVFLSTKQYQDAYNERNKLRGEINSLQKQYFELNSKLTNYRAGIEQENTVAGEIEKELEFNRMLFGNIDVEGEGIQITLKDISNELFEYSGDEDVSQLLIHNYDITYVLNDLKSAGAEAISINGQRVTERTEVFCQGNFLRVNGVKLPTPFYINAIGNKEALEKYMMAEGHYLKMEMIRRGINVKLDKIYSMKISAYNHKLSKQFINEVPKQ